MARCATAVALVVVLAMMCAPAACDDPPSAQRVEPKGLLGDVIGGVVGVVGEALGIHGAGHGASPTTPTTKATTAATATATAIATDGSTATATAVAAAAGGDRPGPTPKPTPKPTPDKFLCLELIREHLDRFFHPHTCMYGLNCGHGCDGTRYLEHDDLDHACYRHSQCVLEAGEDYGARCECHSMLHAAAVGIVEVEASAVFTRCPWCEFWCAADSDEPSDKHVAAIAVTASMSVQLSFEQCGV